MGCCPKQSGRGLLTTSASTLDRLRKAARVTHPKGLCGTKPVTLLKKRIPKRGGHWDVTQPGIIEADKVAHCGNSLAGNFVWSLTLTLTDILTRWTECRATWNKDAQGCIPRSRHRRIKLRRTFSMVSASSNPKQRI